MSVYCFPHIPIIQGRGVSQKTTPIFVAALVTLGLSLSYSSFALAQSQPSTLTYKVQRGDTLIGLGKRMLKSEEGWREIAEINRLPNANKIRVGQKLLVPAQNVLVKKQNATVVMASGTVRVIDAEKKEQSNQRVAEGEILSTGSNGSAVVELKDGSRFKVLPNSTVQLSSSRNYLQNKTSEPVADTWFAGAIRVISGAIEANITRSTERATPTRVETATAVVGVRGTQFRVKYEEKGKGNSAVEVTEGLVAASNTKQVSQSDISGGYGAIVNPDEKEIMVRQLLPAIPSTSLPQSIVRPFASKKAIWSFKGLPAAHGYELQIAKDAKGEQIVKNIDSKLSSFDVSDLKNGTWYFNLRAVDAMGLAGLDSKQQVTISTGAPPAPPPPPPPPVPAPKPKWTDFVAEKNDLQWHGNYQSGELTFTLRGNNIPKAAKVSIASSASFNDAVHLASENNTVVFYELEAEKRYYVRFSDGLGNTSRTYSFSIPFGWGHKTIYIEDVLR